ncbi:MAG: hypothetical protein Q8P84_08520 [Deltaproteobacteria bacterium]|nr:hypothetical protein [Deltaproteobacteria bacterium]
MHRKSFGGKGFLSLSLRALAPCLPAGRKQSLFFLLLLLFPFSSFAIDFGLKGYYRTRAMVLQDVDLQTPNNSITHSNDRFGLMQFNQMRLRVQPNIKVNDNLGVYAEFDFLDNIVFGSKANQNLQILSPVVGTLTLPSGAGTIGEVGGVAGETGSINVRRAWMEIMSPIGKFKLGRQPSHWGLGIFQNDGEERQGDFGDSEDRILYLTEFDFNTGAAMAAGLLWDIPFEAQQDPRVQGLGGVIRDNGQDLQQYAAVLYYEHPQWAIGTFAGARRRSGGTGTTMTAIDAKGNVVASGIDGSTLLYFGDIYAKYNYNEYTFQFEGVYIGGDISTGLAVNAIPFSAFSSSATGAGIINLPAKQSAEIMMAAFEAAGIYDWGGEWSVKTGYASGDANALSGKITQYGFRPDYRIALLMFYEPMGSSPSMYGGTANNPSTTTKLTGGAPITGNFINNALYITAGYAHTLNIRDAIPQADWMKIGGTIITAWAPKKNVNLNFAQLLNNSSLPAITETANSFFKRWYGVEIDATAEALFFHNLYTSLETGVLIPGREYNTDVNVTDPGNIIDPIPSDKASIGFAARFTAMIEF